MMKVMQFKFGGDHSVVHKEKPTPADDQVLVRVVYSALDTSHKAILDKELMAYFTHAMKEPLSLGYHYSGVVEAVGRNVTDMAKKQEVFGHLQYVPQQSQGAFAEYIVVPRSDCAVKPATVSHAVAAASTTEAITALQGMRNLGGLEEGHSVLIVGGAGGVGQAAVMIAKALGAHVTAICSSKDVDTVKEFGADIVLNRTSDPDYLKRLYNNDVRFNVIFDTPNMLPAWSTKLLKPKGAMVNTIPTFTFVWNRIKTVFSSKRVCFIECHSTDEDLKLIGGWLADGTLKIPIDGNFKVKDMEAAMQKQYGKKNGRVVVQVEDGW